MAREAFLAGANPPLDEIASTAGVGIATLYRHFPNREALIRAVYHEVFNEVIIPQMSPEAVLPAFRNAFIVISIQVIDLLSAAPTTNLAELTAELIEEHSDLFALLLDGAQEQGDIRPDLTYQDTPHILGMLVVGLSSPNLTDDIRTRYLSLMFDALKPGHISELPPWPG